VLKPETVELMTHNAIGDLSVPMVRSNNPALALEVETFPGQVKKWGLTFLINTEDIEGFRSAGSLTWGGVHNTYFWIDLKKRITAVALMQILPIGDPRVQEMMIGFERALYAAIARTA
jgi:methyl acetate hydrolase